MCQKMFQKMSKCKIVFLIPTLGSGGAERVFFNLIQYLDRRDFEVALWVGQLSSTALGPLPADCAVRELGTTQALKILPALLSGLRAVQPDILVATLGFTMTAAALKSSGLWPRHTRLLIRLPITLSAYLAEVRHQQGYWRYYYQYALNAWALRQTDGIIAQSQLMQQDIIDTFFRHAPQAVTAKITVLYNPLNWQRVEQAALRQQDRLPRSRPCLVSVGRLEWQKGYDDLILAFQQVLVVYPHATLTILGEGSQRAALTTQIQALKLQQSVFLAGFTANPYATVAQADLFVSASRYEGYSNAILEALVLKVPVVATNCPSGVRELIQSGKNGWLVELHPDKKQFIQQFAQTLRQALVERHQLDWEKARQQVIERHDVLQVTQRYARLLKTLCPSYY